MHMHIAGSKIIERKNLRFTSLLNSYLLIFVLSKIENQSCHQSTIL